MSRKSIPPAQCLPVSFLSAVHMVSTYLAVGRLLGSVCYICELAGCCVTIFIWVYLDHSIQCKIDNQVISWRFLGSATLFLFQHSTALRLCQGDFWKAQIEKSLFIISKTYVNEYQAFSIIFSSRWQAITASPGGFCTEDRELVYALNFSQPKS